MKINRGLPGSAGAAPVTRSFTPSAAPAPAGPTINRDIAPTTAKVDKALTLNVHTDGTVGITSDVEGGAVDVGEVADGKLAITETLPDGTTGDSFEISVSAPEAEDTAEEPAEAPGTAPAGAVSA